MPLPRLIGEPLPHLRPIDLLTEDHPHRPYPTSQSWRTSAWLRWAIFCVTMFVAIFVYLSVHAAVAGSFVYSEITMMLAELAGAVVAFVVLSFAWEGRVWPHEIAPRRLFGLLKGVLLGLVLVAACIGVLALVGTYTVTGFNPAYSPWMDLLSVGVVAGIAEEIMFRGVVFRLVEEGLGTWGAVVVSAIVFGGLHLGNADASVWGAIAIIIEAGILFAGVYVLTRSLWWCIGLHFAWNMAEGPLFGSVVSGSSGIQHSWLTAQWSGPVILSGGQFGLEGSIVPVILLGALGVFLLVYAARCGVIVAPIWVRKRRLLAQPADTPAG